MYKENFPLRLAKLRLQKNVSARDMSLSIGQNPSYINSIENGKTLPSMSNFFYICDYLEISPRDFFDYEAENPETLNELEEDLKRIDPRLVEYITAIVKILAKRD